LPELDLPDVHHKILASVGAAFKIEAGRRLTPARVPTPGKDLGRAYQLPEKGRLTEEKRMSDTHALPVKGFEPYKQKEGESYMSKPQLDHFAQLLLAWKRQLQEEVERTVHHMRDDANNYADPADRATQEEEFALELRARDRERKLIRKIDQTLDMIRKEDYGYCEQCGIEIGLRRLEARPTATMCIDCKTLEEIREKQRVA
jgi:DnaK suppressor protein